MTKPIQDIITKWLKLFGSEAFAVWYTGGGNFDRWISGDLPSVDKAQLYEDLSAMCQRYKIPQDSFGITSAIVLIGRGADKISLTTTLPSPFPNVSKEPLCFNIEVEAGNGEVYIQHYFPGIPIEIIDIRPKKSE